MEKAPDVEELQQQQQSLSQQRGSRGQQQQGIKQQQQGLSQQQQSLSQQQQSLSQQQQSLSQQQQSLGHQQPSLSLLQRMGARTPVSSRKESPSAPSPSQRLPFLLIPPHSPCFPLFLLIPSQSSFFLIPP